ncbi:MAG: protease complex subunit PrcB family protein [Gillisia sp.]
MKTSFFILLISVLGCSTHDFPGDPVKTTLIAKDILYGNGEEEIPEQNLVIRDSESWNELIKKMNSVNQVSDSFTQTDIDFTKFTVLAVFDKVENSGGYDITIEKVFDKDKALVVKIRKISPAGFVTQVMTQPFHIIKIPATQKQVIFE